ncbi:MAG TPA: hypothetical protein VFN07_12125 [Trueperaceae bacterium]|nr:hypothetical protein [Trueperaceae bacterium]
MAGDFEYIQPSGQACLNPACSYFEVTGQGNIQRFGVTERGVQRFRCKECRKTFTELTGTPMHRLRHDEATVVEAAAKVLLSEQSISDTAREYGVPYSTVKRWVDAVRPYSEVADQAELVLERQRQAAAWRFAVLGHALSLGLLTRARYDLAMDHITEDSEDGAAVFADVLRELVTMHGDLTKLGAAVREEYEATLRDLTRPSH